MGAPPKSRLDSESGSAQTRWVNLVRLSQIRVALLKELAGNDARLRFINTRLILTLGIDLNEPTHAEDRDAAKVKQTLDALNKMGFLAAGKEGGNV